MLGSEGGSFASSEACCPMSRGIYPLIKRFPMIIHALIDHFVEHSNSSA